MSAELGCQTLVRVIFRQLANDPISKKCGIRKTLAQLKNIYIPNIQYLETFDLFPVIQFSIHEIISEENHVAILWNMPGTNPGSIGEITVTGKEINTSGMTIYCFKRKKVFQQPNFLKDEFK